MRLTLTASEDWTSISAETEVGVALVTVDSLALLERWGDDEPDYDELAMDTADALLEGLRAGGWTVDGVGGLNAACLRIVSPGPSFTQDDVSFDARLSA